MGQRAQSDRRTTCGQMEIGRSEAEFLGLQGMHLVLWCSMIFFFVYRLYECISVLASVGRVAWALPFIGSSSSSILCHSSKQSSVELFLTCSGRVQRSD